jgi:hypothetical protein
MFEARSLRGSLLVLLAPSPRTRKQDLAVRVPPTTQAAAVCGKPTTLTTAQGVRNYLELLLKAMVA